MRRKPPGTRGGAPAPVRLVTRPAPWGVAAERLCRQRREYVRVPVGGSLPHLSAATASWGSGGAGVGHRAASRRPTAGRPRGAAGAARKTHPVRGDPRWGAPRRPAEARTGLRSGGAPAPHLRAGPGRARERGGVRGRGPARGGGAAAPVGAGGPAGPGGPLHPRPPGWRRRPRRPRGTTPPLGRVPGRGPGRRKLGYPGGAGWWTPPRWSKSCGGSSTGATRVVSAGCSAPRACSPKPSARPSLACRATWRGRSTALTASPTRWFPARWGGHSGTPCRRRR